MTMETSNTLPTPIDAAKIRTMAACIAAVCLTGIGNPATADEIATGNPDLSIRWDNTLRYLGAMRMEGRDARLAANPTADDGNFKFDQHDIGGNRIDWLTEGGVIHQPALHRFQGGHRQGSERRRRVRPAGLYDERP